VAGWGKDLMAAAWSFRGDVPSDVTWRPR
jgi:hypothetical protein